MAKLSPDNHLSGSVLPAWLGFSPYQSPYDILERARAHNAGEPRPELDSLPADIGSAIEPIILERGLRQLGIDPGLVYHWEVDGEEAAKPHPQLALYYSDDGIIDLPEPMTIYTDAANGIYVMNDHGEIQIQGKIILEAKFTTVPKKLTDPPLHRGPLQLQAGMMCHQAEYGILFTCYGGRTIEIHVFPKHQDTTRLITQAVIDFETHMDEGTWPEPRNVEELGWKYNDPDPEPETELSSDMAQVVEIFRDGVKAIKAGEDLKNDATEKLMAALGNHKVGAVYTPDGKQYKVTWPWRTTKAKPPKLCPHCEGELEPAKPESTTRQKSISVKEV
jgi:hypothetical protein